MGKKTALFDLHKAAGAKVVDFAGWQMPVHYGSQIEEHHAVRKGAGMFDVSHMTVVDFKGAQAREFLRRLLANDVARLKLPGKALYSCMLNETAGVIDDLIVYYMNDNWFRMVVNAATHDKDLDWIGKQATDFDVDISERDQLAMIAVQGPEARDRVHQVLGNDIDAARELKPFFAADCGRYFVGRTGYTGEDGYEILLSGDDAVVLWASLSDAGVRPIGLGARDTLRLEAGMNLYGQDMDETTTPLESGLAWTVAWEPESRNFTGRTTLERQRAQKPDNKLVGLVLQGRGVLRPAQKVVIEGVGEGIITSGGFSPTLGKSVAMARVPRETGSRVQVEIRDKRFNADVVKVPFVRFGKSCIG